MRNLIPPPRLQLEPLERRRLLSVSLAGDYPVGGFPVSAAMADFNDDGRADLAVANSDPEQISVLLGNANGMLTPASGIAAAGTSLTAGDLHGDGKIDLVATARSPYLHVYAGNGNGTFQGRQHVELPPPPPSAPSSANYYALAVTIADVDADGHADLVAACEYEYPDPDWDPNGPYPPTIFTGNYFSVLLGNATGTFAASFVLADTLAHDVEAAELNGDGKLDLVLFGSGQIQVLLGAGGGTFAAGPSYYWANSGGRDGAISLADYNADGKTDLAISGTGAFVALGDGSGSFGTPVIYPAGPSSARSLMAADFNLDGWMDLVTGNWGTSTQSGFSNGTVSVLLNDRTGGFRAPLTFDGGPGSAHAWPIAVAADFSGDGRPDVAVASYSGWSPEPGYVSGNVRLLLNDGIWTTKTWVGPASGGDWFTASNWSPGGVPSESDVVAISGSAVNLSANATVGGLNLTDGATMTVAAGGGRVLRLASLSIGLNSALDLNDNGLILDYTGSSRMPMVRSALHSGYAGGAWNGAGVNSSTAAANSGTGLGFAEASGLFTTFPASFLGQSVDATSILVRYTLLGDANLDGAVNLADFNRLAANFGQSPRIFSQGDFSYDGVVNLADFNLLASRFGAVLFGARGVELGVRDKPFGTERITVEERLAEPLG